MGIGFLHVGKDIGRFDRVNRQMIGQHGLARRLQGKRICINQRNGRGRPALLDGGADHACATAKIKDMRRLGQFQRFQQ